MADSLAIPSLTSTASTGASTARAVHVAVPTVNAPTASVNASGRGAEVSLDNPQVAAQVEAYLRANGHDMKFSFDKETGQTIVRIYNSSSGELVRQIPGEEMVRLAHALRDGSNRTLDIEV